MLVTALLAALESLMCSACLHECMNYQFERGLSCHSLLTLAFVTLLWFGYLQQVCCTLVPHLLLRSLVRLDLEGGTLPSLCQLQL